MTPVLHLDPMVASAVAVGASAMLGDQSLKAHAAGRLELIWPDLALLERCHEDALRPAAQQLRQVVLVKVQRQLPEVVAVQRQDVEGVELDLLVVLARVQ